MKPKRIFAQTVKELTQLGRDRLTLTLALFLPLILLLLFGFAVSLEVNKINFAIQDLDLTPTSREYIATFERTNKFNIVAFGPQVNVPRLLDKGSVAAGLIIRTLLNYFLEREIRQGEQRRLPEQERTEIEV